MSKIIKRLNEYFVSRGTSGLEAVELISLAGIIFSIFFPIRYVLKNEYATILGYYSDFTSISLYIGFIFVLIFIGINIYREILSKRNHKFWISALLVWVGLLIIYKTNTQFESLLSIYHYLRITCVLLLAYLTYKSPTVSKYKTLILWICVFLGGIQGIIALLQFWLQQSLGLNLLGESPLAVNIYGVAKAVSYGTTYIRGYGTFPSPNILAGILVIVSLLNLYLLNNSYQIINRLLLSLTYFLIIMGVFASLSRGGIFALVLGLTTWLILNAIRKKSLLFMRKLWIAPVALITVAILFSSWIVSRGTIESESINFRKIFYTEGKQIVRDNWLLGTGPGTNLIVMNSKLGDSLEYWDIQPIHNFWLITWSELGIIGLIIGFFILKGLLLSIWKAVSRGNRPNQVPNNCWNTTLSAIALALLPLLLIDHYFYTIWPAQVLLAIILGLMWKEIVSRENNI